MYLGLKGVFSHLFDLKLEVSHLPLQTKGEALG